MPSETTSPLKLTGYQNPRTNTIELHQDDPVHFELLLKWLYTGEWDRDIEAKRGFWGEFCLRSKAFVAIGVYALANKYNVPSLRGRAFDELLENPILHENGLRGRDDLSNMVFVHCTRCLWPDCLMCHLVWAIFLQSNEAEDPQTLDMIATQLRRARLYLQWAMQAEEREVRLISGNNA